MSGPEVPPPARGLEGRPGVLLTPGKHVSTGDPGGVAGVREGEVIAEPFFLIAEQSQHFLLRQHGEEQPELLFVVPVHVLTSGLEKLRASLS